MNYRLVVMAILVLVSCGEDPHSDHHDEEDAQIHEHAEGVVELSSEQMRNLGLRFDRVKQRSIRSIVRLKGRVELPPNGMSVASSPIGGQVVQVFIEPGQQVRKGQHLFSIHNLELVDWQKDYLKNSADISYLDRELERQRILLEEKISAQKTVDELMRRKQQAEVEMRAIQKKLESLGITTGDIGKELKDRFYVFATQKGRVEHININPGAFVTPSQPLVEIINSDRLHLHLQAFGQASNLLKEGQILQFNVQTKPETLGQAKIKWINNIMDEENNNYDIHAEIQEIESDLIPGEFVEARIIAEEDSVATVPVEAITFDRGLKYLFAVEDAEPNQTHFRKVLVKTGIQDLGYTEILPVDPLNAEDQIVIEGAFFLMAESKKGEMAGGGHHH